MAQAFVGYYIHFNRDKEEKHKELKDTGFVVCSCAYFSGGSTLLGSGGPQVLTVYPQHVADLSAPDKNTTLPEKEYVLRKDIKLSPLPVKEEIMRKLIWHHCAPLRVVSSGRYAQCPSTNATASMKETGGDLPYPSTTYAGV